MPPIHPNFPIDATGVEVDCLHWLAEGLDQEAPSCIAHDQELPCVRCERRSPQLIEGERS